jgi:hypothetical protein
LKSTYFDFFTDCSNKIEFDLPEKEIESLYREAADQNLILDELINKILIEKIK